MAGLGSLRCLAPPHLHYGACSKAQTHIDIAFETIMAELSKLRAPSCFFFPHLFLVEGQAEPRISNFSLGRLAIRVQNRSFLGAIGSLISQNIVPSKSIYKTRSYK